MSEFEWHNDISLWESIVTKINPQTRRQRKRLLSMRLEILRDTNNFKNKRG